LGVTEDELCIKEPIKVNGIGGFFVDLEMDLGDKVDGQNEIKIVSKSFQVAIGA